jgi:hypothetical protein
MQVPTAQAGDTMSQTTDDSLIDDLMDAYVEWREESAAVESAYQRWSIVGSPDTASAFAAYVAALDREEIASAEYAELYEHSRAELARERQRKAWLSDAA